MEVYYAGALARFDFKCRLLPRPDISFIVTAPHVRQRRSFRKAGNTWSIVYNRGIYCTQCCGRRPSAYKSLVILKILADVSTRPPKLKPTTLHTPDRFNNTFLDGTEWSDGVDDFPTAAFRGRSGCRARERAS
jgi:hypothetical protein